MIRWIILLTIAYIIFQALKKKPQGPRPSARRDRPSAKDPYAILHVARNADAQTIKQAYRKALSENHPDKVAHLSSEIQATARQRMDEIQWAYDQIQPR
jgi:DnaJ-domain-containing protein 1